MRAIMVVVYAMVAGGCVVGVDDTAEQLPPPNADPQAGCSLGCHGADSSNAPPMSLSGAVDTTVTGIGAHQVHMNPAPTWHRKVDCADCHLVPIEVSSPGHIDDGDRIAELSFSERAGAATWDGTTCTARCHGSPAWGGTHTEPVWTQVDGTQATCGSCHGTPPPAPHPAESNCASCHPTMEEGSLAFRDPDSHINGVVDMVSDGATGGCTSCHGSTNSAPPKDLSGDTAPTASGVGAHQAHLAPSTWHRDVTCSSCHLVPQTVDAPGHRDGDNVAELVFDTLNPTGIYTAATTTCSNQYCHGNGRGGNGTISWLATGPLQCGACHSVTGTNMSGDHRKHLNEGLRCSSCHAEVVDGNLAIINALLHVDGVHEVKMANGTFNPATRQCTNTGCHGTETW